MKITIHRGTHQIGGIAIEICTDRTRIFIDMGDELSLDSEFVPSLLNIPGVTDANGCCDAVFFSHYHGDHTGQMSHIRKDVPLYIGELAKKIMWLTADHAIPRDNMLCEQILRMKTFCAGIKINIGDICITPYSIDHSACDSYMFLLEANGKSILYTGDFRLHGFRGKAILKILRKIGKVDVLITEGTTLSRSSRLVSTEYELQQRVKGYINNYKYVFVLCATTNLDRIIACARSVPYRKYSLCDEYQYKLVKTVCEHWHDFSLFYKMPKLTWFKYSPPERFAKLGGLMFVRANSKFEAIIRQYDPAKSILLYSMWDGYRTKPGSKLMNFLTLTGTWEILHTSGHASQDDIRRVIETVDPKILIPVHTDKPEQMKMLCSNRNVLILQDGEEFSL